MLRLVVALLMMTVLPAQAQIKLRLFAAGSLRAALSEVASAYQTASGNSVEAKYGASGLLRDELMAGAGADVFASANMEHPRSLTEAGRSGPTRMFARNSLCALVRPGLAVETGTLLERMLDPAVKLGTSTPKADPSGDYAFAVFGKAEALRPGTERTLAAKALLLTGGPTSPAPPPDRSLYGKLIADGAADLFLTYCTNAVVAAAENPGQRVIALPEALAVGADYGLTVLAGAPQAAEALADFILSVPGQAILTRHGFTPPTAR
jgi:ABC-type molybdate transport system substrate-binding protein